MKTLYLSCHRYLLLSLVLLFCLAPLNATSQTVDELLKQVRPGVLSHTYHQCCDLEIESTEELLSPGTVTLRVSVVANVECDLFRMELEAVDNLQLLCEARRDFTSRLGDTTTFELTVDIPSDDTCGLELKIVGCDCTRLAYAFFAPRDERVKLYPYDPRGSLEVWLKSRDEAVRREIEHGRDSIAQLLPPPPPVESHSRRGYYDKDGNFIPRDSLEPGMVIGYYDLDSNWVRVPNPADSISYRPGYQQGLPFDSTMTWNEDDTGYWHYVRKDSVRRMWERNRKPDEPVDRMELMHELEKTPLEGFSSQRFVVGDRLFVRHYNRHGIRLLLLAAVLAVQETNTRRTYAKKAVTANGGCRCGLLAERSRRCAIRLT